MQMEKITWEKYNWEFFLPVVWIRLLWEEMKYQSTLRNDWFKTKISILHIGIGHKSRLHAKSYYFFIT